jgi:uncharacterized coiled-coil protein SlyX
VIRFLLGVLVGIVATVYFFHTGGGDYFIASSTKVRILEAQLQIADQKQDQLAKKLEESTAVIEKMTTQFTALEQRFQALNPSATKPLAEKPPASAPAPESVPNSPPDDAQDTAKEAPSPAAPHATSPSDPSSPL